VKADHHAIVIGIGTYPGFSNLEGPSSDAAAFRDWLIDPTGGDVDPANVGYLRTDDFHPPGPGGVDDAHPFDDDVQALFRPFVRAGLADAWFGERLYVYMAGHGFTVNDPSRSHLTALYAANAAIDHAPHVVGTVYAEWFRLNAVFREIVLIMDCCRTADPLHGIDEPGLIKAPGRAGLVSQVRKFYGYGAQWGQVARERRIDGAVQGIFTATLLDALRRAPPNRLGQVNGTQVKNYVHQNFDEVAGEVEVAAPDFDLGNYGEIVFARRQHAPGTPVRIRLAGFAGGEEIVVSAGPDKVLERIQAPGAVVALELQPGFYKVSVEGTGRQTLFEVGGEDVELDL